MGFRLISETVDGSIRDVIQLKTLNRSVEYRQMYEALAACPRVFVDRLVEALNSLGQSLGIDACSAFDVVLCGDLEQADRVKMYNWWRGFFGTVARAEIPKDREADFQAAVSDMVSEIMKAGSARKSVVSEGGSDLSFAVKSIGRGIVDAALGVVGFCQGLDSDGGSDGDIEMSNESGWRLLEAEDLSDGQLEVYRKFVFDVKSEPNCVRILSRTLGGDDDRARRIVEDWRFDKDQLEAKLEMFDIRRLGTDDVVDWLMERRLVDSEDEGRAWLARWGHRELDECSGGSCSEGSCSEGSEWVSMRDICQADEGSDDDCQDCGDGDCRRVKRYRRDGVSGDLVTGSRVDEMTIEQEIDRAEDLAGLLWGQGQRNMEQLIRSGKFTDEEMMGALEDTGLVGLTEINDFLAYEFDSFLDMVGADVDLWRDSLEIERA